MNFLTIDFIIVYHKNCFVLFEIYHAAKSRDNLNFDLMYEIRPNSYQISAEIKANKKVKPELENMRQQLIVRSYLLTKIAE